MASATGTGPLALTASRYQDQVHLPYFWRNEFKADVVRCAELSPRQQNGDDVQPEDPDFPVGILEPIRDRGTCLDALHTMPGNPDRRGITDHSLLPDNAACSGCFKTSDDLFFFCDYDASLGYDGYLQADGTYAQAICVLSVSPSPPPPSPPPPLPPP